MNDPSPTSEGDRLGPDDVHVETWLAAAGRPDGEGAPLNVPPVVASNFQAGGPHTYSRGDGTPTVAAFEELMSGLEGGGAVAFASGLAACAAVFDQLEAGALVAIPADCYQGVGQLVAAGEARGRWISRRLEVDDEAGWRGALSDCDLVWLESPSNPLLAVVDLPALLRDSTPRRALVAVDNTFATPLNQRPLEVGADVVVHSATKFIGGHSDLLMGVALTRDDTMRSQLAQSRTLLGAFPGALEAYLATRGARTLALRMERSELTAMELARRLDAAPWVRVVRYPGLATHPSHGVAERVLHGFGAMMSFDLAASAIEADRFVDELRLIHAVTSLGGVESTIERRAKLAGQEHLPESLLRLSVGCEHVEDLWADLERAATRLT